MLALPHLLKGLQEVSFPRQALEPVPSGALLPALLQETPPVPAHPVRVRDGLEERADGKVDLGGAKSRVGPFLHEVSV